MFGDCLRQENSFLCNNMKIVLISIMMHPFALSFFNSSYQIYCGKVVKLYTFCKLGKFDKIKPYFMNLVDI